MIHRKLRFHELKSLFVVWWISNNHGVYSDKFALSVLHLNQIEFATEEDKAYRIDYWARIFKAETWEELRMYAEKNEYLEEAAEALYVANADEIVRQQCRARQDAEILQKRMQYAIQELEDKNAELEEIKMQLEEEAKRKDELIQVLIKKNRLDDIDKAIKDMAYREKLYEELNM